VGTFIQSNSHSLTVRDICSLANVLISEQRLKDVIVGRNMGNKTFEDAKLLGGVWKKKLKEMNLWVDTEEFGGEMGEFDDARETFGLPTELVDSKFDVAFPFLPLYVGYSKTPIGRQTAHRSRGSPSDGILIPIPTTIESLNQLVNVCVSRQHGKN